MNREQAILWLVWGGTITLFFVGLAWMAWLVTHGG